MRQLLPSYSGSFLRRVPHRLAWSRTEQRSSSGAGSVIRQQRLDRGQDRSCLLYGRRRTRQRRLGYTAVVGRLAKIEEEVIVSPQIRRQEPRLNEVRGAAVTFVCLVNPMPRPASTAVTPWKAA